MSERDVVFNLKASNDPRAVQAAKEFEDMLIGSLRRQAKSAEDYEKQRVRIAKATQEALIKFATDHREAIIKDADLAMGGQVRIAQAAAKELNRLDEEQAKAAKRNRDRETGLKIQARKQEENARIAAEKKAEADGRAALQRRLVEFKRAKAEEAAIAAAAQREQDVIAKSTEKAQIAADRNRNRYREAARNLREQFSELSESVMRVGRGITLLGLAGEKDLAKLQEGLLKAQAAMDIFSGGLKVINKLERAWSAYVTMIETANVAMATHNALSAVGGAAGLARGIGAGAIRTTASTATGRAVSAGAGAAAGAGLLALLSKINPLTLLGRSPAAVTNLVSVGGRMGAVDAVAGGAGARGALGHMAARYGFSSMAAGGGSVSAGLMGARAIPIVGQVVSAGMAGYSAGSALSNVTGVRTAGDMIGRNFGADNYRQTAEAEKRRLATAERAAKLEQDSLAVLKERSDIEQGIMGIADRVFQLRLSGMTNEQKSVALAKARADAEQKVIVLRQRLASLTSADEYQKPSLMASIERHQERVNQLTEQRGEAEKAIAQTRVAAARQALDSARRELDTVTSRIKSEQDALKTAEERFGLMSRADQQEVMMLLSKARAGRQLDASQITKLKSLGTTEAERLASGQARNLANGDYSGEARTLAAIDEANRRLRSNILDITDGKSNKYGVNPGAPRMLSRRQKQAVESTEYQIEVNERRAEQIRLAAARDTAMRRSIFGEERGRLAQSLNQRQSIEARISQQLTVVARFDNTAKQVAEQAVRQLMEAQAPWVQEFERRLNETMQNVGYLQNQRRQMAPGRS
jgi:hypothetical protein